MNKLEQAARQLLDYWDLEDSGEAADRYMADLRDALAEPELNLNCKSVQKRLATVWGYVKAEQVEQEPDYFGLTHDHTWLSIDKKQYDKLKPEDRMACYIAPGRTKDLTDDELLNELKLLDASTARLPIGFKLFARAVIAADREKNK